MPQIREELGPKTLKRHFQTDMSFGVEEVDMVSGLQRGGDKAAAAAGKQQGSCAVYMV